MVSLSISRPFGLFPVNTMLRAGGSLVKISPVDKSSYTTTTTIQSGAVVTAVDFGTADKSQVITRRLDGARYVVLNELRIGSRVLKVRSVFNRVDEVGG